ncbi:hypothetical protein [Wohlfahrtiimonas chitiniclastica]|uniref:hypothetical protein n=1 Tax=Wohlfahrtiimonas chitiniclastica TaxID=400946 RepID=UPI000B989847|nr:hypothetical protein [Wohlfahrtiimonas chitiniclastica]MBS7815913.1 hypothetical protein [Wohlfahrtiimonas chitiniclastica]MBS7822092.1 hypothetical protein [Wohlfahrtiimonas chitiniclastica]MBS7829884.1 hypothetical protein [Wohlfahrtiimonas chitiniclastica]MBS7831851.1 hypothetical protein [Wohlfahrtiimonas chitiniclastica]MBS7835163.1 hypothetical protein [Wohlfahrtiimonas chitiniclastica]
MRKLRLYLLIAWGVLTALFYALLKSKNRKIEKQNEQIKQHKSKHDELQFINDQEKKTKDDKNSINTSSESDVDKLLERHKAYRD